MQNNNTITQTQNKVLFPLGQVFLTVGAREALKESNESASEFLAKHSTGNWGDVCEEDAEENNFSVREGFRILSVYKTGRGEKIWVISEASGESTTILLPEEYGLIKRLAGFYLASLFLVIISKLTEEITNNLIAQMEVGL
jgi:hypothetical protein